MQLKLNQSFMRTSMERSGLSGGIYIILSVILTCSTRWSHSCIYNLGSNPHMIEIHVFSMCGWIVKHHLIGGGGAVHVDTQYDYLLLII